MSRGLAYASGHYHTAPTYPSGEHSQFTALRFPAAQALALVFHEAFDFRRC